MIEGFAPTSQRAAWSVSSLVREVGNLIASRFSVCTVRGEISGFSRASSGHCYFNLKDPEDSGVLIRCAMFKRAAFLLGFSPTDGQSVELRGRVGIYEPRGELQMVVESMQRAGDGTLFEKFMQSKARLDAQGLFSVDRKRKLPLHPRAVGVVTSLAAAALHDVLTAMSRRSPHVGVVVYPSAVQGPEAPSQLAAAIALASIRHEVDVLIVCRGGGSLEDLWAFNDERVVRAVVAASMPVVTGVGHETDVTLCDFAADLRAPTPTAAAELSAPVRDACLERLASVSADLRRRTRQLLDTQAQRIDRVSTRLMRPGQALQKQSERLTLAAHRLVSAAPRANRARAVRLDQSCAALQSAGAMFLQGRHRQLDSLEGRLRALDPSRVLARGYAWLSDEEGRAVTSVARLQPGQTLKAVLDDGTADVVVTDVGGRTAG